MFVTHWLDLFALRLRRVGHRWRHRRGARPAPAHVRQRLAFERLEDRTLLAAPHPVDLAALTGVNGFRLDGIDAGDFSGWSVNGAGDVNGDGFDDLSIGAFGADPGGDSYAGETYVVFGQGGGFGASLDLSTLNGTNGFRLDGIDAFDRSGCSVSGAGDVNGDGFDDLIIGAFGADPGGDSYAGETYVVFGQGGGFGASLDLSTLNGTNGFRLDGIDASDISGRSVSGAGDVNGDGFDDLIIGADWADPGGDSYAGETYVVFGQGGGLAASLDLSTLNGTNGFRLDGINVFDLSGCSVSGAGDVNGDGFDDLIIGAYRADPGGDSDAGETYVVFGGNFTGGAETQVGGGGGQTLTANQGAAAVDRLIGGLGNDTLLSDGGDDILIGGEGDDSLQIVDVSFAGTRRLDGGLGTDTLALTGSGLTLDLTAIADNRLQELEIIDLTGSGANTLTLDLQEVLNLSGHSNTLTVLRNSDDVVHDGGGWTQSADEVVSGVRYKVFTQGAATLKIENVAPIATADVNSTTEDAAVNGNVLTDGTPDSDPDDDASTLTVTEVNGIAADVGTEITLASGALLTVNADGSYTYDPNGQFEPLNLLGSTTDTFTYAISDPGGLTSTATVTVTIDGVNDAPVAAGNQYDTNESEPVTGNLLTDGTPDSDVDDAAGTLVVSEVNGVAAHVGMDITLPSGALLTVNADGTYRYFPNDQFEHLRSLDVVTDSFTYTIRDPGGLTSTVTVTITIHGVNDDPVATENGAFTNINNTTSGNVLTDDSGFGVDFDVDSPVLTVAAINGVAVTDGEIVTLPSGALLTIHADGRYVYDPHDAFNDLHPFVFGRDTFEYTVVDGDGLTDTAVVTVTIQWSYVAYVGNTAYVTGTDGVDSITYDVVSRSLQVNGVRYLLPAEMTLVSIDGRGARDVLSLFGTPGDDTAIVHPGTVFLEHNGAHAGFDVTGVGVEAITLYGQGGVDHVTLHDSTGDDRFLARPSSGALTGAGFECSVYDVEYLTAVMTTGSDLAQFFDSTSDDLLVAGPGNATLSGLGFQHGAQGYDTLLAAATAGGHDSAKLTGSTGNDVFAAGPGSAVLSGTGYNLQLQGFETVQVNGLEGLDIARLTGSAGNDLFTASPTAATFVGTGLDLRTLGFERHFATGGAGMADVADLTDSAGADTFVGISTLGTLSGTGYVEQAIGFDTVRIRGVHGGLNRRLLTPPLGYTLQSFGTWV